MLKTVKECDDEIIRIESEVEALIAEKSRVLQHRSFLAEKLSRDMSLVDKILVIIKEIPGITTNAVLDFVGGDRNKRILTSRIISKLQQQGTIEIREENRNAKLYIKEH